LEREESGTWPERGFLIPFAERIVAVDLDPARCEAAAARYLEAFAAYNSTVPGAQPASPSAEACRWCEFIMRCDATWAAADQDWAPQLRSAAGTVVECAVTALGTATIVIDVADGTLPAGRMAVTGVRSEEHPAVNQIDAGSVVRLAGLRRGRGKATFSLPPWGHLAAE
jgi:threonine dehydrogenase-like Zn-dependent dehydrogenase